MLCDLSEFCFDSAVARSPRPWRLDSRILHDETTRRKLGNLVKESLVGVRPEPASWDRLKGQWQSFSTLMGRHLRERHRGLLQDTILRIRIVRRGGALTPFMRAYLDQLQRRYERYLRWDSTAATVLQAQGSPSVHPEVLRYTHRTSLQAFERQQTPSASGSPGHLDNGRFAAHFRSLAQSDAPVDRYSVSSHPLLSGLPKISAEDDAGLRRPPSATELSTADLFDKLSVHVSREEILEAPASRLVERLVVADQPPPPPGTVQPYPWLALTSSTLPDHVRDFECSYNDILVPKRAALTHRGTAMFPRIPTEPVT
ncbi:uncharacterized protein ISCGN_007861 [Ixodes scapularis]